MEFAVIDVETTGLDASSDRIIEIGIVSLDSQLRVVSTFDSLVDPQREVGARHIHGITEDLVENAPVFSELASDIARILSGNVIVAHNARFDVSFLNAEFERSGLDHQIDMECTVCTMDQARIYLPHMSRSLKNIATVLGISDRQEHRSLADAHLCEELFRHYISLETMGQRQCESAVNRLEEAILPRQWERARAWQALSS